MSHVMGEGGGVVAGGWGKLLGHFTLIYQHIRYSWGRNMGFGKEKYEGGGGCRGRGGGGAE